MKTLTKFLCSALLLAMVVHLSGCSLFESLEKKEELPPITQEGKNTFGCLVNGKLWLPKGNDGTPNFSLSYDPTFMGGAFNISTYRYYGDGANDRQSITIFLDSVSIAGKYDLFTSDKRGSIFNDWNSCIYYPDELVYKKGHITITKLDLQKQVVAGTFEFIIFKKDCDTIRVTQGRFDKKI